MSKETKQDRTVRAIFDQVTEGLHQLKSLVDNPNTKESDVERWCEGIIRSCLGFTATNGYSVRAQEAKGKMRPDLVIYQGDKPICIFEIKKLGFDLTKSDFRSGKIQLSEYLYNLGNVRWGFLCNGYEWKLFDFGQVPNNGVEIYTYDFRGENDLIDFSKRGIEDLCYELINFHEISFKDKSWEVMAKEATAFSPESLVKAILSTNAIKYIAKEIKGEHDYKVCHEILLDKTFDLLIKGLDDSIVGWNEAKQAELSKFVTAQKRANKRKKSNISKKNECINELEPQIMIEPTEEKKSA